MRGYRPPFPRLARDRLRGRDHARDSLAGAGAGRYARRPVASRSESLTREEFRTQLSRGTAVHRGCDARWHVYRLQHGRHPDRASVPGRGRGLHWRRRSRLRGAHRRRSCARADRRRTGLADYWEIAPDNVTYTFHLNKDAKWHDGVDVTAEDVQFSFDALANPETGSAYTGTFVDTVESWRAIDDDTFEVVAKEPVFHLPVRHPDALHHPQAHLGERPLRRVAQRSRRDRHGPIARHWLRPLQVPGVAAGRERHPDPQ